MNTAATTTPYGWRRRRLRFDARLNPKKSSLELDAETEVSFVPMEAIGELGGLDLSITKVLEDVYNGYTYFADFDVCVAKITPCFENGKGALAEGLTHGVGFGTTELHVVRSNEGLEPRFLFYISIAHDFRNIGAAEMLGAGGQKRVPEDFIKDWRPPLPSLETQRRIATFLDDKTARIDALVEKKRALLDRLAEKRQALITHAVTKGLDPNVPMKDSGIDWLCEIPAHWEVRGLTKCTTRVDYRGATPQKVPSGVFLVTARNIRNGSIDYDASQEFIAEEDYEQVMRRGKPLIGEILLTTEAPLGEIARVDREDIALAQRVIKFASAVRGLSNSYLAYWFQSGPFRFDLLSRATGSTALGIKASKIVELRCLIPSVQDQELIVSYLERATRALDHARDQIETSTTRLTEYRASLITAAVTGQLDVADAAVPPEAAPGDTLATEVA